MTFAVITVFVFSAIGLLCLYTNNLLNKYLLKKTDKIVDCRRKYDFNLMLSAEKQTDVQTLHVKVTALNSRTVLPMYVRLPCQSCMALKENVMARIASKPSTSTADDVRYFWNFKAQSPPGESLTYLNPVILIYQSKFISYIELY